MEAWTFVVGVVAIIGTLGGLIGLLMRQNSQAHALIGKRIDDTRHDLGSIRRLCLDHREFWIEDNHEGRAAPQLL